ncbi:hypothetical protein [Zooshikella ganghwensis]|uniref:hypothetical protein n=1 Tax=Zooshikella ganghwensis TaxID=202772 RepID=UPI000416CEA1|nr:hypothetical protein [Zooshikella ganghwensis]
MKQEPIINDNITLANSEIKKIVERVINSAKIAAEKVAVEESFHPLERSFEDVFKSRFDEYSKEKKETIRRNLKPIYTADKAIRTRLYGDLGAIDVKAMESVEHEVTKLPKLKIDPRLLGIWTPSPVSDISQPEIERMRSTQPQILNSHNILTSDALLGGGRVFTDLQAEFDHDDFEPQAVTDKLALYVRRVKCVDETNPEWWGSDEVSVAGTSVDETGDTKKINEHFVGGGFDDGDSRWYNPHWRFHWFSMREGDSWPKSYYITMILAEKDNGGLAAFLQKLWEKVESQVKDAVAAYVGGLIGSSFGPLGTLIGAAVGYAVAKIVDWFIDAWNDDIFPPKTVSCTVPSFGARWTINGVWGSTTSGIHRSHFYGHGGHYYIEYYWKLYA